MFVFYLVTVFMPHPVEITVSYSGFGVQIACNIVGFTIKNTIFSDKFLVFLLWNIINESKKFIVGFQYVNLVKRKNSICFTLETIVLS